MYRAFGLLPPTSTLTLDDVSAKLGVRFPDYAVTRSGEQITVARDDWEIELRLNGDPGVLAESADLAEKIAGVEDGGEIAACARRIEVWSDTPDPTMEHFNEFIQVIEVLQSFPGLIAIDPREPALM